MFRQLIQSNHLKKARFVAQISQQIPRITTTTNFSSKAWHPKDQEEVTKVTRDALALKLQDVQRQASDQTVPWFLDNMPASYFRAIYDEDRLQHLNAITSLKYAEQPELMLRSPDGKLYTFIRSGANYPGLLASIMKSLPNDVDGAPLARVKIFTALDDTLALDVFRFGKQEQFTGTSEEEKEAKNRLMAYIADIQAGVYADESGHAEPAEYFEPEQLEEFMTRCNSMYIKHSSPRRVASQIALYQRVRGTEGVAVEIEHGWEKLNKENKLYGGNLPQYMITIASANVLPKSSLQKAATYLGINKLNVLRAHLDIVDDPGNGHVALNRILVTPSSPDVDIDWEKLAKDLKYLKWIDDRPLNLALKNPEVDIDHAEVIVAYGNMLHGLLAKQDPFAYSLSRIFEVLKHQQHLPISVMIAELFLKRFDPQNPMKDEEFEQEYSRIKKEIRRNVETEDSITLMNTMLDAVKATLRTNKFIKNRYALAMRLDPTLLGYGTVGTDIPFGVFYITGRRFKGFHVRFRDISRGGLRVVAPLTCEQHSFESSRQYNEAYNLAFAQQLKNKDIPEGGSKAVVLVEPNENAEFDNDRDFVIRKSIKAFADALLDLNTTDESVRSRIVDHYGKDELIYLGPDENIIPEDITWMTNRAGYREYPIPRAFISSKPDAGINHKVYGVTSEGVAVFADVALHSQGFKPREEPFTVKITGGTDGDVAGNMIKILNREYGQNARVVGICDGTGVVEDPSGLDMTELLRLVDESLPLSEFNESCLSSSGSFYTADTPEGIRQRNSMHNRVKADVFVPAGGRPNTINENNWEEYLDDEGKPSSKLIVEGANLFVTPEARQQLFEKAGVVIVKDSSANKCGVVCSSYEIIASMMLETSEFLGIKDELVKDVLDKLRHLARVEANLLFREYKKDPSSALPPHSERISRAIIRVHDALIENYDSIPEADKESLFSLIEEHLPEKLREVALDRVQENVPLEYIKCIIAANLASKIVYREGLQYVESLPDGNLSQIAVQYLKQEKRVESIVKDLEDSGLENVNEIADLLIRGGVRAGVDTV